MRREDAASDRAESEQWRSLARSLTDGYDPETGRHVQFAGYDDLELLLVAEVGPVPLAADRVLGHERVARTQVIKQADVLMGHHMIPDALERGSFVPDLDHYLPRTAHGELALAGDPRRPVGESGTTGRSGPAARRHPGDRSPRSAGTAADGLHLAALAGLWQAVVLGFAGVRVTTPDDDALGLDPHIPTEWGELRITLQWHGTRVRLRCRSDAVHVACRSALRVRMGSDAPVLVTPPGDG